MKTRKEFLDNIGSPLKGAIWKKYPFGSVRQYWAENPRLYSKFFKENDQLNYHVAGHPGIDVATFQGDDVLSMHDGYVYAIKTDRHSLGGLVIWIASDELNDNGEIIVVSSVYGHLSEIKVTIGQRVEKGYIIGLEGNTGFVISGGTPYWGNAPAGKGIHLHFGMYEFKDGKKRYNNPMKGSLDPLPFITEGKNVEGLMIVLANIKSYLTSLLSKF